jgi:MoaA/NifB/PqqE/SkfB family radical SAM enzyme
VNKKTRHLVEISQDGLLKLPPELAQKLGLQEGSRLVLEENGSEIRLVRPVSQLSKIYVEVTNTCSLGCRTCMRNVWDEPAGWMEGPTFERVLEGLRDFHPPPTVFFGGFGEPLSHPQITGMIQQVKALGASAELISNGVHLTEAAALGLMEAGLDTLWVSLDGAHAASYADLRLGAQLPGILDNLRRLRSLQESLGRDRPRLGIAFVAMKRNITDLLEVLQTGESLGAVYFSISNVLAHTVELRQEILYQQALYRGSNQFAEGVPQVSLPRLDQQPEVMQVLGQILGGRYRIELGGGQVGENVNRCPFIQKGSTAVRWDGSVSPCLPLLHTHHAYLDERLRLSKEYSVGSLQESSLRQIWNTPGYVELRERLQDFDFSPCTYCNSCEMADANQEDCFGSTAPACGGCLWAQGLIQCP